MGRGRAKAKQTKVARELKYSSPTMDLDALQRDLGGPPAYRAPVAEPEPEDEYSAYADRWKAPDDDDDRDVGRTQR